jgi:hypothetical protein
MQLAVYSSKNVKAKRKNYNGSDLFELINFVLINYPFPV